MRLAPLVLLLTIACGAARPADSRRELRLVVLIVIDQLPTWSFLRREKLFSAGLARLVGEGRVYERGRYPYAATYTACGHAALATGAPPSTSGVVANNIWDRSLGKWVPSIHDAEHEGSPRRLRAPAIADGLVGGSAVAISFKMRSAILLGGHRPAAALWWDDKTRCVGRYFPASRATCSGDRNRGRSS